jgi:phosphate transport system substrate-binding protein
LINKSYKDAAVGKAVTDFLTWYLENGEGMAADLYYAPLPESLIAKVKAQIGMVKY